MTPPVRVISVEARPGPLNIDLTHTAVLVIDMQNDFGAQGGMFERAGIDISVIQMAVCPTRRVIAAARDTGIPIVYLKMAHLADRSDTGGPESPHGRRHRQLSVGEPVTSPDGLPSRILIDDTWNTDILPELAPLPGDAVVRKHRYSGFFETDLDARLLAMGVRSLIVTGCTTSVCVESTVRDAMFRDYDCLVLEDCTGQPESPGVPPSRHEASLRAIQGVFGSVSNSTAFIRGITCTIPLVTQGQSREDLGHIG
jgi:ureidoacrylate peracid hydrolase